MIATLIGVALLILLRADGDQVADPWIEAAISSKEFTHLAGLFAQGLRCRDRYIALLCARRSVLSLHKNPAPVGKIIFGKRLRWRTRTINMSLSSG